MSVSHFVVDNDPGEGPALHRHRYDECWSVVSGKAAFVVDGQSLSAVAGDTVAVSAGVWHRFFNIGPDRLVMVCIHDHEVIEQEWARPSPTTQTGQ